MHKSKKILPHSHSFKRPILCRIPPG